MAGTRGNATRQTRVFKCPVCGGVRIATKKDNRRTSNGHIKDMFCPYCNDTRKFIQIGTY